MAAGFRKYGWRPSPPDPRDAHHRLAAGPPPPERSDGSLRARAPAALDQQRSDCVAHGTARAVQIALTPDGGQPAALPSRDWLYFQAGVRTGDQLHDNGRYIRDAIKSLATLGWPDETVWPYGKWPAHPGGEAFRMAYDRRADIAVAYHRLDLPGADLVDEMKRARAAGLPIVAGADVTNAFEYQDGKTPVPAPTATDEILGGHAFAVLEYTPEGCIFENSWSPDWADNGYGYLSWDYVRAAMSDVWAVKLSPMVVS
jgi:hypothetical protein